MKIEIKYNLKQEKGFWRLQTWVSRSANKIDADVFVYQQVPKAAGKDELGYQFSNIASLADMTEYPTESPDTVNGFFRCRYMDVSLESSAEMMDLIKSIRYDFESLTKDYKALNEV